MALEGVGSTDEVWVAIGVIVSVRVPPINNSVVVKL